MMNYYRTNNSAHAVRLNEIPTVSYAEFYADVAEKLRFERYHVAHYFALMEQQSRLRFYCLLLDDQTAEVLITSFTMDYYAENALPSLTALHPQMHPFEREISERYGVCFGKMPWTKPLRYPFDRVDRTQTIDNYPFYAMAGGSLHEVNVGPIHAGIIEPGAFRFICNGENVLHLEIALGYQHRGVEALIAATDNRLRQMLLAESVAGDSSVTHATAFAEAIEKLTHRVEQLDTERSVALELERIAMGIADTGALCMDVGYQLGQVACEALRTMTINTTQAWCGNRFGKGLIRPAGTDHPLTTEKAAMIRHNVAQIARRYAEVCDDVRNAPTLLARFEQCGIVPHEQMWQLGGVGQAARASGMTREVRSSHPWGIYAHEPHHTPITEQDGDVMARLAVRFAEVRASATWIERLLDNFTPVQRVLPNYDSSLAASSLAFGLVEGWRGETCQVVVTNHAGQIVALKIKDPSLHNWSALALAVRGEGISDFPICNKSFNLSYCGHDL